MIITGTDTYVYINTPEIIQKEYNMPSEDKYGFVYIWYDRKRKMYYIGCHWGSENDGYICSSNRMRNAYNRRKEDFKRKILSKIYTNRIDLLNEEYKWLQLINEDQLGKKYYNIRNNHFSHWTNDIENSKTIKEKLSKSQLKRFENNPVSEQTRMIISKQQKGRVHSKEHNKNVSIAKTGKPMPESFRISQSARIKANPIPNGNTPETIRKRAEALRGRPLSESHKKTISEAHKRRRELNI